jgi:hypothetical protein
MMAVGDQVLQQLGQQLGLPQGAIDLAQAAFHGAAGDPGGAIQNLGEASAGPRPGRRPRPVRAPVKIERTAFKTSAEPQLPKPTRSGLEIGSGR